MLDEDGANDDNESSTYSKFKTQNEMDIDKQHETGPQMLHLDELDEVLEFGIIRQYINQGVGMVLIEPNDPLKLFDIDNVVTLQDKQGSKKVIGFVFELVGPITAPLYSIQLYPQFVGDLTALYSSAKQTDVVPGAPRTPEIVTFFKERLHGAPTCVVKRTIKMINGRIDEIMSKKGCDASNMFDEEVLPTEQEFSDDEMEKEAKRIKKLKRARPDGNADQSSSSDSEEGELKSSSVQVKGGVPGRGRGGRGGQMANQASKRYKRSGYPR